jgi:hypothetical protein
MAANAPYAYVPKGPPAFARKLAQLRPFLPLLRGQRCPEHCPPQPGPILGQPGPIPRPSGSGLGPPLDIREAAELIGCSPWTIRQTLLPRGLPHFRFKASGKLIFYRDQVIRWIETQQGGRKK